MTKEIIKNLKEAVAFKLLDWVIDLLPDDDLKTEFVAFMVQWGEKKIEKMKKIHRNG